MILRNFWSILEGNELFPHGVNDPSYNHLLQYDYMIIWMITCMIIWRGSLTLCGNSFPYFGSLFEGFLHSPAVLKAERALGRGIRTFLKKGYPCMISQHYTASYTKKSRLKNHPKIEVLWGGNYFCFWTHLLSPSPNSTPRHPRQEFYWLVICHS